MLEAHILPHLLAASLTAAQPAATPLHPNPPPPGEVAARRADGGGAGENNVLTADISRQDTPSMSLREPPRPVGEDLAPPAAAPTPVPAATPAPNTAPAPTPTPAPTATAPIPPDVPGQRDPLEGFNRLSYKLSQPIDHYIFRPIALTYKAVVPHPLRDGARNFITNLYEPLVFFNDVVQLRPKRALHTLVRMALNTLVGLAGVFDVAKRPPFHLVHHENGFGDTLGYYGIGPVAYVYLPILGPTDLRDIVGGVGDAYAEPRLLDHLVHPDSDRPLLRAKLNLGKSRAIAEIVQGLDRRAESDDALETIRRTSVDPYATLRSSFLQDRAGEIAGLKAKNGQARPSPSLEDPLLDPADQKPEIRNQKPETRNQN